MLLDKINLNALRVFESVYRHGSMTEAAGELGLTQSGVSQHIKQLEEILQVSLFQRVKQKLVATQHAHTLYEFSSKGLKSIEEALASVGNSDLAFSGKIKLGAPREFGRNLLKPHIEKLLSEHARLRINLFFGDAIEMSQMLLEGQLDIAFVDAHSMDPSLKAIEVFEEIVLLCAHSDFNLPTSDEKPKPFFEKQRYITYFEDGSLVRRWLKQQHGISKINLNIASTVMDVEMVYQLIKDKVGVGILPEYFLRKVEQRDGASLKVIGGESASVNNSIKMAYLKSRSTEPLLGNIIKHFKETDFRKA
jgi:DNA-binding transcriptional LysR family regulator